LIPETRRLYFCLLASLLAHALILPLAAWLWRPADFSLPAAPARIRLFTVLIRPISTPRPVVLLKPTLLASPPARPAERKFVSQKHLQHGAQAHTPRLAPHVHSAGSAAANFAVLPQTTPVPAPASRMVATKKLSPFTVPTIAPNKSRTSLSLAPNLSVLASKIAVPLASAVTAPDAGAAVGSQKGAGSGEDKSSGGDSEGSGNAGEPFGVGAGLPGPGGPRHVIYVLDISGSMTSRISRAEEELRRALSGLGPGETFNIIAFSDQVQQMDTTMLPASASTVGQASHFFASLQVSGGTNLEAAMTLALTSADVNEVVLLTDGVPTLGETNFGKLARQIRALNKNHARISTVGLIGKNPDGTDDSFEAKGLLRQMAQDSGGASELVTLGTASP